MTKTCDCLYDEVNDMLVKKCDWCKQREVKND